MTNGTDAEGSSEDVDGIVDEKTVCSADVVAEPDPAAGIACSVLSDSVIVPSLSAIVTTSTTTSQITAAITCRRSDVLLYLMKWPASRYLERPTTDLRWAFICGL